jgi:elongation factor Ts
MLIEINSQTDFVAMSDTFIQLSNEITEAIFKANIADLDKALQTKTISGISVAEACIQLTSKIGEKTSVRRFVFVHKQNNEVFAHYVHSNNKIGVLLVLSANANPIVGKNVAMHAAAMAPKFLNKTQVDQT